MYVICTNKRSVNYELFCIGNGDEAIPMLQYESSSTGVSPRPPAGGISTSDVTVTSSGPTNKQPPSPTNQLCVHVSTPSDGSTQLYSTGVVSVAAEPTSGKYIHLSWSGNEIGIPLNHKLNSSTPLWYWLFYNKIICSDNSGVLLCGTVCQLKCAHKTSLMTFSGRAKNFSLPYCLLIAHLLLRRISSSSSSSFDLLKTYIIHKQINEHNEKDRLGASGALKSCLKLVICYCS